jgi:hypothetical protein
MNPWDLYPLAWEYLLPERPMNRRLDTLEVHSQRWVLKRMELDVAFATASIAETEGQSEESRCLVPAAYIPKRPVASDLEVKDSDGTRISVPTRNECMDLTKRAIAQIGAGGVEPLGGSAGRYRLDPEIEQLVGDVIANEPLRARICRLELIRRLEQVNKEAMEWLQPILRRMEDNYMLWVPIEGAHVGTHHVSIWRSDRRGLNPIFPVKRKRRADLITVDSAVGQLQAEWHAPRKWRRGFDASALVGRLLVSFGLMPVKFEDEVLDADRFSSFHLEMVPPSGLLVREVKAGEIAESEWDRANPWIRSICSGVQRTIHGADTRTGHLHLEMQPNPSRLNSRITIGLRPGTTTLWAMVVLLTCGLLWSMRHEIVRLLALDGKGAPDDVQIQIIAAVLLVGPTFAASWMLRLKDPALIRSMLAGTQALLLTAAILSVATALVFADMRPFGWEPTKTVQWYASCSFVIAMPIAVGWLQARSGVWIVYRRLLNRTWKNLVATFALAILAWATLQQIEAHQRIGTAALFVIGFSFTAIAGNRTSVRLGEVSRVPAAIAGLGAIVTLALVGRELQFFNRIADKDVAHRYGGDLELLIAATAFAWLCYRIFLYYRLKAKNPGKATEIAKAEHGWGQVIT